MNLIRTNILLTFILIGLQAIASSHPNKPGLIQDVENSSSTKVNLTQDTDNPTRVPVNLIQDVENSSSTKVHLIQDTDNPTASRQNFIHDTATLRQVRQGVDHIYNCEFTRAQETLDLLKQKYGGHPMTSFFEGLIIYWKYYPLADGHPGSEDFKKAMELTWERADSLKQLPKNKTTNNEPTPKNQTPGNKPTPEKESASKQSQNHKQHQVNDSPGNKPQTSTQTRNRSKIQPEYPHSNESHSPPGFSPNEIEGVFFDLVARAFIVMNYADNGKSSRAITHLNRIYRDILKGMEMERDFKEFMFTTGLYNYYREAFPEAYPIYKAALLFFHRGDKVEGLSTLRRATTETDFMRVEAMLFLSLIHINFENNPDSSLYYTSLLHQIYPGNSYFHAKYTEMLLINEEYEQALQEIEKLMEVDSYNRMKATIYRGIYEEKHLKDPVNQQINSERARRFYEEGVRLSEPFGERANYSKAYAYIGLSRYYKNKDDNKKAKDYYKKAKNASGYEYVFK